MVTVLQHCCDFEMGRLSVTINHHKSLGLCFTPFSL